MYSVRRGAKRLLLTALGREILPRIDGKCNRKVFGNTNANWYVAVDPLSTDSIIYSVGVGEDISFDLALINHFDVTVHAFDPTPKSISWVRQQTLPKQFILHEVGIADVDGQLAFNPPVDINHVSHRIVTTGSDSESLLRLPVKRLSSIMKELDHDRIDVLKMDIEGAEYGVIEDMTLSNIRPQQILVEFHHRFPGIGIQQTKKAIQTLRSIGYALFAVSASGEEYSFLRL